MNPQHWAFFDVHTGAEITRGWQGYEYQARSCAQRMANERGHNVEFIEESRLGVLGGDKPAPDGEIVEPEEES